MQHPHSYLFVPGNRSDRFEKAANSGAHRIIFDLEDAVAPQDKATAREAIVGWFRQGGRGVARINGADTIWFDEDLAAVAACDGVEVMVPKAAARSVRQVSDFLPDKPLIALIESVEGLVTIHELAAVPGVTRLAFGNLDFGVDSGISGADGSLDPARFQLAIASRHAGLLPPVDGVTVSINDESALEQDLRRARNFGFSAKLCIHPKQVLAVNAAFTPSDADLDWAHRILDAVQASGGAVTQVDGKMVDKPVIDRARRILAESTAG